MPIDKNLKIPEEILLSPAIEFRFRPDVLSDPESWTDYEIQSIRSKCGPRFSGIPTDNIRRQLCNMRKRAKLGRINGDGENHGASKSMQFSDQYKEYMKSSRWKYLREEVLKFWKYRCAFCYSPKNLDVHHRTYENLGKETRTDCVALCRECHKVFDRRRQREMENSHTMTSSIFDKNT